MKKVFDFLSDPYVLVPTLLGGAVAYFAKGKDAEGAGRYTWPAGGVAAGLATGYVLHTRRVDAAAAVAAAAAAVEKAKADAAAKVQGGVGTVRMLPPMQEESVVLDEYGSPDMDYEAEGDGDIDVDAMFEDSGMPLDEYDPVEPEYPTGVAPTAAPSDGYRGDGPEPSPYADATPTEAAAYELADQISAHETGHGSLGGNGTSDADLAGGWGGYSEGTLNGDIDLEDLATGVPGMAALIKGRSNGHN